MALRLSNLTRTLSLKILSKILIPEKVKCLPLCPICPNTHHLAIATAFLLQSNRRKLFQQSMRRRHLRALDQGDAIPLPPPIMRYLPPSEQAKHATKGSGVVTKDTTTAPTESKDTTPLPIVHPILPPPPPPPPLSADRKKTTSERKRRRETSESDAVSDESTKRKRKNSTRKTTTIPTENGRHAKRKLDDDDAAPCPTTDGKLDDPVKQETHSDEKRLKKSMPDIAEGDLKSDDAESGKYKENGDASVTRQFQLFMRVRRNSFPPVTGHIGHHGESYWSPLLQPDSSNPAAVSSSLSSSSASQPGTVLSSWSSGTHRAMTSMLDGQSGNTAAPAPPSSTTCHQPSLGSTRVNQGREQSTQTDSSYTFMTKHRRHADHPANGTKHRQLERSISELVRKGRTQTEHGAKTEIIRKRKIPSTIQIAHVKRKRKSRIRRRRNIKDKSTVKRRSVF